MFQLIIFLSLMWLPSFNGFTHTHTESGENVLASKLFQDDDQGLYIEKDI